MRSRTLLLTIITLLIIPALSAQMMPGSGTGRMPGMGVRAPMPAGGVLAVDMMELPVAADGTVFVLRRSTTGGTVDLVAISAEGTQRWKYPLDSRSMSFAALSADALVFTSMQTPTSGTTLTFTSQLIGISIASGTKLWSVDLKGDLPMGITTYSGGFYVVTAGSLPPFARKLVSVDKDGKVRWTVSLD